MPLKLHSYHAHALHVFAAINLHHSAKQILSLYFVPQGGAQELFITFVI